MKAGVYLRVSTEEQRDRQTIETQRDYAERYCALQGIKLEEMYADDGVSGTVPLEGRPEGSRMLKDARAGRFELVLVYRLDRLGRVARQILNSVNDLEAAGAQVKSMTEAFDTSEPAGRLMLTLLSGFAGFERDSTVARSSEGSNRLARLGVWLGGICPFGYRVVGKDREARLEISDEIIPEIGLSEAEVVRMIFRSLADDRRSCVWVADHLTHLGVPTAYTRDDRGVTRNKRTERTAGIWRPSRIRNLVTSSTYKGVHVYGKRSKKKRDVIEREVPAIVSEEVWEKAQAALKANMLFSPRNSRRQYLLRGLIKCGLCGLTYIGTSYPATQGTDKTYYVCNGKHGSRGIYGLNGAKCPSKAVGGSIEDTVWHDVEAFLRNPGPLISELTDRVGDQRQTADRLRSDCSRLRIAMEGKASEKDLVLSLYRRGRIDSVALDRQLDQIATEEDSLREQISTLDKIAHNAEASTVQLTTATNLLNELNARLDQPLTWEFKRQIIELLVDHIRVDTEGDGAQKDKTAKVIVRYLFTPKNSIGNCTDTGSSRRPA